MTRRQTLRRKNNLDRRIAGPIERRLERDRRQSLTPVDCPHVRRLHHYGRREEDDPRSFIPKGSDRRLGALVT